MTEQAHQAAIDAVAIAMSHLGEDSEGYWRCVAHNEGQVCCLDADNDQSTGHFPHHRLATERVVAALEAERSLLLGLLGIDVDAIEVHVWNVIGTLVGQDDRNYPLDHWLNQTSNAWKRALAGDPS